MPLGPSGCILRASLVGDAHKYAQLSSNDCAASHPVMNFLPKCSEYYPNSSSTPNCFFINAWHVLGHLCLGLYIVGAIRDYRTAINWGSFTATGRAIALRCANARRIPSIAKEVIKDQPPWLTKGMVIPVIGSSRSTPPMLTTA